MASARSRWLRQIGKPQSFAGCIVAPLCNARAKKEGSLVLRRAPSDQRMMSAAALAAHAEDSTTAKTKPTVNPGQSVSRLEGKPSLAQVVCFHRPRDESCSCSAGSQLGYGVRSAPKTSVSATNIPSKRANRDWRTNTKCCHKSADAQATDFEYITEEWTIGLRRESRVDRRMVVRWASAIPTLVSMRWEESTRRVPADSMQPCKMVGCCVWSCGSTWLCWPD